MGSTLPCVPSVAGKGDSHSTCDTLKIMSLCFGLQKQVKHLHRWIMFVEIGLFSLWE